MFVNDGCLTYRMFALDTFLATIGFQKLFTEKVSHHTDFFPRMNEFGKIFHHKLKLTVFLKFFLRFF